MIDDDTELPFTMFIAAAQLLVGIGLIVFGTSVAVRIIGGVVVAFAALTGGSAWYYARRQGERLLAALEETRETAEEPEPAAQELEPAGDQPSQGPRQPPNPDASRSASSGPQEPGR